MRTTDVLIIGSGVAGVSAALELARNTDLKIDIFTGAHDPQESNTRYAQGGIVGRGDGDNPEVLVEDILTAGAGASLPSAARILAEEGPDALQKILIDTCCGAAEYDMRGVIAWGREAAHSRRCIAHVGDTTGQAIISGMLNALEKLPNVTLVPDLTAIDLITFPHHSRNLLKAYLPISCHGAYVFDQSTRMVHRYLAGATILATGGLGRIFSNTTNPMRARGDGLAMAHRAGTRIINAEYIQFHPTALSTPGMEGFLISEAVRGEGGVLLTPDGNTFMEKYSPEWKDLAARDVVARAIHHQMETHGYSHVMLDIASYKPAEDIRQRFPNIHATCLQAGIDITRDPIPVVPAAHYFCGGVAVDEWGRSDIHNLYAVGEVSCTGVHGANRLASTSLLEGLLWGQRAAVNVDQVLSSKEREAIPGREEVPPWDESNLTVDADPALIQGDMQTIQNIMWHYVGLIRSGDRMSRAIRELRHLQNEIETFYRSTRLSDGLIGLRNAVEASLVVAQAARHNRHSRGCHYRVDSIDGGDRLL